MSNEQLRKQEWLETIDLLQNYYTKTNRNYTEKKGKIYCILGEIYQDVQLVSQGKELLDSLDLLHKMINYKLIALQLNQSDKLKSITKLY